MSAIVSKLGKVRQLDRPRETDEMVRAEDVSDTSRLARLLMRMLRELASLRRRWAPRRIDFEDVEVDSSVVTKFRLQHGFGGRVRWWVVDWASTAGGQGYSLERDVDTDNNTLVLISGTEGIATIRIEEAG